MPSEIPQIDDPAPWTTITHSGTSSRVTTISVMAKCALLGALILLMLNQFVPADVHAWLSSIPLALVGAGYILLQIHLRPSREILLKRLVLAMAFLFWAVDQLLPSGRLAVFIGDAVIGAYVLDLFWMMQDQKENSRR